MIEVLSAEDVYEYKHAGSPCCLGGFLFYAFGKRLPIIYRLGFLVLMRTVAVMGNLVDSITGDCSAEE